MQLKVIQLNIQVGALLAQAVDFLKKAEPDILFLQEVGNSRGPQLARHFDTLQELKRNLPMSYHVYAPTGIYRLPEGRIEMGNAIFSKYPIELIDTIFYDVPYNSNYTDMSGDYSLVPRNLQYAVMHVKDKSVHLFNTHGIWGKEDNDRKSRMAEIIAREVQGKEFVILAGDFNTATNTRTIQLIESVLVNTTKDRVDTTFNIQRKTDPIFAHLVVDMIFVSTNMQVLKSAVPKMDISDHLPVMVTLSLAPRIKVAII